MFSLTGSACDEDFAAGTEDGAELIPKRSSSNAGARAAGAADFTGADFGAGTSSKSSKPSSTGAGAGTAIGFGFGGSSRTLGGTTGAGAGTDGVDETGAAVRGSNIRETLSIIALLLPGIVSLSLLKSSQIFR